MMYQGEIIFLNIQAGPNPVPGRNTNRSAIADIRLAKYILHITKALGLDANGHLFCSVKRC
jgi:hypothetical protein